MLRIVSIRSRLMFLLLLVIASLVVTNLVLVNQTRIQTRLIGQQAHSIDLVVSADAAVQTFGNLKYWLTDFVVSQLVLSKQRAGAGRKRLNDQLAELAAIIRGELESPYLPSHDLAVHETILLASGMDV